MFVDCEIDYVSIPSSRCTSSIYFIMYITVQSYKLIYNDPAVDLTHIFINTHKYWMVRAGTDMFDVERS